MENDILTEFSGTIKRVCVKQGETVGGEGAPLVEIV